MLSTNVPQSFFKAVWKISSCMAVKAAFLHTVRIGTVPILAGTVRSDGRENGTVPFDSSAYWTIGIPHPWRANQRIAEIKLRNRAIGTSSSQFQSFRHEGKRYGHIIDPRTGYPAEGVLSATVVAPTSALADALSTAFYVLGPEKTADYCQNHPEIGAVLLTQSSRGGNPEIHIIGIDDRDFTLK